MIISLAFSKPADKIIVRIYSAAYRRIFEYGIDGDFSGRTFISIPSGKLSRLADGMYYIVLEAVTLSGGKAKTKITGLIVLK